MAVAFVRNHATQTSKTSGTTLVKTFTAGSLPVVGNVLVWAFAADNLSATTPTASITDSKGNTWTVVSFQGVNATAAAGIVVGLAVCYVDTAPVDGDTATLTFSGAITARVASMLEFSGVLPVEHVADVTSSGSGTTATVTTSSIEVGNLVLGVVGSENSTFPTADADTTNGSWSTEYRTLTAGGSQPTNVALNFQYKITTTAAGTQTYNSTIGTDTDYAILAAVLQVGRRRTATSSGAGSSSATGSKVTGPQTVSRTATGSGTGSASAARLVTDLRTASASGTGSSTSARLVIRLRTASSAGAGTSAAARTVVKLRTATASGAGSSVAVRTAVRVRTAAAAGSSSSTADRTVSPVRTASAAGAGTGTATGSRLSTSVDRTATAAGAGSSTAASTSARARTATGTGVGSGIADWVDLFVIVQTDSGTGADTETLGAALSALDAALGADELGSRAFDDGDEGRWFDLHALRYAKGRTLLGAALSGIPDRSERPIR